jgi:hypothetical protein
MRPLAGHMRVQKVTFVTPASTFLLMVCPPSLRSFGDLNLQHGKCLRKVTTQCALSNMQLHYQVRDTTMLDRRHRTTYIATPVATFCTTEIQQIPGT